MDGVALWVEARQRMEIETRQVHVFRLCRDVQSVQTAKDAILHLRRDLGGPALVPEFGKRLAFERPDHTEECKQYAYQCQQVAYMRLGQPSSSGKSIT